MRPFNRAALAENLVITAGSSSVLPTLCSFFYRLTGECKIPKDREWREALESFFTFLVNFSGLEVEGRELSVGFLLLGPDDDDDPTRLIVGDRELPLAVISPFLASSDEKLRAALSLFPADFRQVRTVVESMKKRGLGWTPGATGQPVLAYQLQGRRKIVPKTIFLLPKPVNGLGTDRAYRDLSSGRWKHRRGNRRKLQGFAAWIRPTNAIRVYAGGRLAGEVMRLRDAAGWAVRNLEDLSTRVLPRVLRGEGFFRKRHWAKSRLETRREVIEQKILYPLLHLSERKEGGTLCFLSKSSYLARNTEGTKHCLVSHGEKRNFFTIPSNELEVYLAQDGAVAVDRSNGNLLGVGCYFKGKGGRKGIAADVAADFPETEDQPLSGDGGLAFVVSHDGPIYVYSQQIDLDESHSPSAIRETEQAKAEKRPLREATSGEQFWRLDFFADSCGEVLREFVQCPECSYHFALENDGKRS